MAKFKAYPEYKDSGVEWLGAIPEDWSVTKLKYIADLLTVKSTNSDDLFVGLENISSGDGKYISKEENIADGASVSFEKNDVLFGKLRPYLAKSWLATFSGVCSSEFLVLRTAKLHPKFLNYYSLTNEFIDQVNSSTYGSKMPRASWEFIGLLPVPTCSYFLSEKVAAFLDHETAKIDNLIEKQKQLIELLKEKRQAVISHAVTKGLNPDVPMKDSGVEWLGEVPAHWIKQKLVNVSEGSRGSFVNGPFGSDLLAEELRDHGVPVVYIRDIKPTGYSRKSTVFVTPMKAKQLDVCKLEPRNVVVSKVGDPPGDACVYPVGEPSAIITQDVIRIRVNMAQFSPEFIAYLLNSDFGRMVVNDISVEGTRKRVSLGDFKSTRFVFPPLKESLDIVRYLNSECEKLSCTIAKATQAVAFMQERRTALISAAVTGKIDVRDWVATDTQDVEEPQEATA